MCVQHPQCDESFFAYAGIIRIRFRVSSQPCSRFSTLIKGESNYPKHPQKSCLYIKDTLRSLYPCAPTKIRINMVWQVRFVAYFSSEVRCFGVYLGLGIDYLFSSMGLGVRPLLSPSLFFSPQQKYRENKKREALFASRDRLLSSLESVGKITCCEEETLYPLAQIQYCHWIASWRQ